MEKRVHFSHLYIPFFLRLIGFSNILLLLKESRLTASTKRAMEYRLRQLFRCLHAEGLISEDLSLYVNTDFAIHKKKVTVLPREAQKALVEWNGNFATTRQARDYTICILTMRLMLRSSDIIKLKLSDIDWVNKKISIIQKKTKQPLSIPLAR